MQAVDFSTYFFKYMSRWVGEVRRESTDIAVCDHILNCRELVEKTTTVVGKYQILKERERLDNNLRTVKNAVAKQMDIRYGANTSIPKREE